MRLNSPPDLRQVGTKNGGKFVNEENFRAANKEKTEEKRGK